MPPSKKLISYCFLNDCNFLFKQFGNILNKNINNVKKALKFMHYLIKTIYYKTKNSINKRFIKFNSYDIIYYINVYITMINFSFKNLLDIVKYNTMSVNQKLNLKLFSHI